MDDRAVAAQPPPGEGARAAGAGAASAGAASVGAASAGAASAGAASAGASSAGASSAGATAATAAGAPAARRTAGPRLTRSEAEAVLRRAVQLSTDAGGRGDELALSLEDLQDVAAQVGVDREVVRQALADVRLDAAGTGDPGRAAGLLGPRSVGAARRVGADVPAVRQAAERWMGDDEGMVRTGRRGRTDRWVKDKRLLVQLRRGLQADRSEGVLRDLRSVAVTVDEDGVGDGAVVSVQADTAPIRQAGIGIAAGGAVGSVALGALAAAVVPETAAIGADPLQFAAVAVPALGATAATTVAVTRSWARKVREAVDQALDGIAMTATEPHALRPLPAPGGWRRTALRWLGGGDRS